MTGREVSPTRYGLRFVKNIGPVRFEPAKAFIERIDVVDSVYMAELVEHLLIGSKYKNAPDLCRFDVRLGDVHSSFALNT